MNNQSSVHMDKQLAHPYGELFWLSGMKSLMVAPHGCEVMRSSSILSTNLLDLPSDLRNPASGSVRLPYSGQRLGEESEPNTLCQFITRRHSLPIMSSDMRTYTSGLPSLRQHKRQYKATPSDGECGNMQ